MLHSKIRNEAALPIFGSWNSYVALLNKQNSASNPATIQFGDSNDFDIGKIAYNNSDNSMAFTTSTGERARITSTGDFLVGKTAQNATMMFTATNHFRKKT